MITDQLLRTYSRDITFDFEILSIFFARPITIDMAGETHLIGSGLGGLSHTFFERGFECTRCHLCCVGTQHLRSWHPSEIPPANTETIILGVNGQDYPLEIYVPTNNTETQGCDFLFLTDEIHPQTNSRIGGCRLWNTPSFPAHCRQLPATRVSRIRTTDGIIPMISRRLASRNWRSPKCPVNVYESSYREEDWESDKLLWQFWRNVLKPYSREDENPCYVEDAYQLWLNTHEKRQMIPGFIPENIFLSQHI